MIIIQFIEMGFMDCASVFPYSLQEGQRWKVLLMSFVLNKAFHVSFVCSNDCLGLQINLSYQSYFASIQYFNTFNRLFHYTLRKLQKPFPTSVQALLIPEY